MAAIHGPHSLIQDSIFLFRANSQWSEATFIINWTLPGPVFEMTYSRSHEKVLRSRKTSSGSLISHMRIFCGSPCLACTAVLSGSHGTSGTEALKSLFARNKIRQSQTTFLEFAHSQLGCLSAASSLAGPARIARRASPKRRGWSEMH